eukprot:1128527-Pyramimonas_sp.AAC.1
MSFVKLKGPRNEAPGGLNHLWGQLSLWDGPASARGGREREQSRAWHHLIAHRTPPTRARLLKA